MLDSIIHSFTMLFWGSHDAHGIEATVWSEPMFPQAISRLELYPTFEEFEQILPRQLFYEFYQIPFPKPAAARLEWTLPCAIMRDSLPVQLHDAMLSPKQPLPTNKDSLFIIMNRMPTHRSTWSSKINGCYVQVLENISSILPGAR